MTRQVPLRELSTVELYALWEAELCQMVRPPNIGLVAACEVHAESRGVRLQDVPGLLARGRWNAALHPRGKDGKFIEVGGLIRLFTGGGGGKEKRGRVTKIEPGKSSDGSDAKISVSLFDDKGNDTGQVVNAAPNEIEQMPEKARLDKPLTNADRARLNPNAPARPEAQPPSPRPAGPTNMAPNQPYNNPEYDDYVPEAPGGGGAEPLKAVKTDDMGGPIPFVNQFVPAARQARADGNTEQVDAFAELDEITSANVTPPEIRSNIVAKRDEYVANGESEKVKVADFALDAWDAEYEDWEQPAQPTLDLPATKEESDAAMNEISSRMLREAGRGTTNFDLSDTFAPPPGEESSPSISVAPDAVFRFDEERRSGRTEPDVGPFDGPSVPFPDQLVRDVPEAPGGEEEAPLDLMGVALGGDPNTTLTPEQVDELAQAIISGSPVDANPPDLDDIVEKFADRPKGEVTDLTLMPPFTEQKTRSKGRTRVQMPQIPAEFADEWMDELKAAGIETDEVNVDPFSELQMTQNELDGTKVGGIMRAAKAGKLDLLGNPLYVSSDGYVLDGHHRWAAAAVLAANCVDPTTGQKKQGKGCPVNIPVVKINMPIDDLLPFGDAFDRARGIETLAVGQDRPSDAAKFVENVPAAPAAPMIPAAGLAAAGEEEGVPVSKAFEKDENGHYINKPASDEDDFRALGLEDDIEEWNRQWQEIRAAKGEPEPQPPGTQASLRVASLRARVHGAR